MNCPECGVILEKVNVYSQCLQRAWVDENGKITDYENPPEPFIDSEGIECPECAADLRGVIIE
jgi:hypothetical protein